jgi:hypothetical protein
VRELLDHGVRTYSARGPAPGRELPYNTPHVHRADVHSSEASGRDDAYMTAGASSSSRPPETERGSARGRLGNHELAPEIVDKLLVIYFTHVHVSLYTVVLTSTDCIESLAHCL